MGDLFKKYLSKRAKEEKIKIALTAKSYKNVDNSISDNQTNCNLAVIGDAVIKLCYSLILYKKNNGKNITIDKQKYESDEVLVTCIVKKYKLLDYIYYDSKDEKIPNNYDYKKGKGKNDSLHKYIATVVEAIIGAIYLLEKEKINKIKKLLKSWIKLIDESDVASAN